MACGCPKCANISQILIWSVRCPQELFCRTIINCYWSSNLTMWKPQGGLEIPSLRVSGAKDGSVWESPDWGCDTQSNWLAVVSGLSVYPSVHPSGRVTLLFGILFNLHCSLVIPWEERPWRISTGCVIRRRRWSRPRKNITLDHMRQWRGGTSSGRYLWREMFQAKMCGRQKLYQ